MEKAEKLRTKQVELLEKLQKYKEAKQQKVNEAKTHAKPLFQAGPKKVAPTSNKICKPVTTKTAPKPAVNRRATLAPRQPNHASAVSTDRRRTIAGRPSLAGPKAGRKPLQETKKNVALKPGRPSSTTKAPNKYTAAVSRPREATKATPKRRRSFTLSPEDVASSPGIKRPSVDPTEDEGCRKRRKLDENQEPQEGDQLSSSEPTAHNERAPEDQTSSSVDKAAEEPVPKTQAPQSGATTTATKSEKELSRREQLMMWRQTKSFGAPQVHTNTAPCRSKPPVAHPKNVTRAPTCSTKTVIKSVSMPVVKIEKLPTKTNRTEKSKSTNSNIHKMSAFERRKSFATNLRETVTKSSQDKASLTSRRASSVVPSRVSASLQSSRPINRRKSTEKKLSFPTSSRRNSNIGLPASAARRKSAVGGTKPSERRLTNGQASKQSSDKFAVRPVDKKAPTMSRPSAVDSRRKSVAALAKPVTDKKAEILARRKAYAESLKNRIKEASTVPKTEPPKAMIDNKTTNDDSKPPRAASPQKTSTKQIAVVEPNTAIQPQQEEIDYSPSKVFAAVATKTPSRDKNARRSVRFRTPASTNSTPVMRSPCKTPVRPPSVLRKTPVQLTSVPDSESPAVMTPVMNPVAQIPWTPASAPRMTPLKKEQSMREKLDVWLKSHGKTPSRYKHLLRFGDHLSSQRGAQDRVKVEGGLSVDELSYQLTSIDLEQSLLAGELDHCPSPHRPPTDQDPPPCPRGDPEPVTPTPGTTHPTAPGLDTVTRRLEEILDECIILLESDCPADTVSQWLLEVCDNFSGARQRARYWICRAKLAARTGDNSAVIAVFEESVRYNAQPPDEIAEALRLFVEDMSRSRPSGSPLLPPPSPRAASYTPGGSPRTPRRRARRDVQPGENEITSSAIKYCYSDTTPFFSRLHSKARRSVHTPRAKVTPVRRSVRLSLNTDLPHMLRDHDVVYDTLDGLEAEQRTGALYVPNRALGAALAEAAAEDDSDY